MFPPSGLLNFIRKYYCLFTTNDDEDDDGDDDDNGHLWGAYSVPHTVIDT